MAPASGAEGLKGMGLLAAPRTLAGAQKLADLAGASGSSKVLLGLASEARGGGASSSAPFHRMDDWMPQGGGGLGNDDYPAPLLQLWKGGDAGTDLTRRENRVRHAIQETRTAGGQQILEWVRTTNSLSSSISGFCALPLHTSEQEVREGVRPLMAVGSVGVGGLLRRAEVVARSFRGNAAAATAGAIRGGNAGGLGLSVAAPRGFASSVVSGHPDDVTGWRVVEMGTNGSLLELVDEAGRGPGVALPLLGAGSLGGV